jgi:hypothetical protein
MKRLAFALIVILGVAGFAAAQVTSGNVDVLGAHNVYGRGCIACHAPHSGAAANGAPVGANSGNLALWGENLVPLYGQTLTFGNSGRSTYSVTIPNYGTATPPSGNTYGTGGTNPIGLNGTSASDGTFVIAACLSCHDGNIATSGMLKGTTVETVTINGKAINPPTLLGNDGSTPGNYLNDHPVGPSANPACNAPYNWDCTVSSSGVISFTGPAGQAFIGNYYDVTSGNGPLANLAGTTGATSVTTTSHGLTTVSTTAWVTCTTCHDQHNMQYFNAGTNPVTNLPIYKPTAFFVRGWYNPGSSPTSNSAAQFCRSCHGGESNEMHGQLSIPTT